MEFDVTSYYGYLLIILGLLLALYSQLKGISTPLSKPKDGIPSIKWSQYAWFSFFSLTFMGTIIFILEPLNIISYRIIYVDTDPGGKISWIPTYGSLINLYTIIVDSFLIFFCFVSLLIGIKTVGMRSHQPKPGTFEYRIKSGWEFMILLLRHHYFFPIFSVLLFLIGVSFLLIGLYGLILTPLFYFITKYGIPY